MLTNSQFLQNLLTFTEEIYKDENGLCAVTIIWFHLNRTFLFSTETGKCSQTYAYSLHKKGSFPLRTSSVNVKFTEEILNRKLHFFVQRFLNLVNEQEYIGKKIRYLCVFYECMLHLCVLHFVLEKLIYRVVQKESFSNTLKYKRFILFTSCKY